MREVMTIGRLVNLEIVNPRSGQVVKIRRPGKWLATSAAGTDLLICRVTGQSSRRVSRAVMQRHQRFHRNPPKGAWTGEHPDPVGPLRQLGLLKALTYHVPGSKILSPEKNPYHWHHAFGDTGHNGGNYPARVYPAVYTDSRGNLYIKRRPGNIFRTTDWIRG